MSVPQTSSTATTALVVDLDDTLYSERTFHESGIRWLSRHVGLEPNSAEVKAALRALREGGQPLQILSRAVGLPVEDLLELHRKHPPLIRPYPDAERLLQRARQAGIAVALLTDGRSSTQRSKINALGIADMIDMVFISEETGAEKTAERAYAQVQRALRGTERITYVGDNPRKDVEHPLRLGWRVFLLMDRGGNVHHQALSSAPGALKIVDSLDQITL